MNEKLIRFNRFNIFSHISSTKIINLSYIIKKNVLAVRCEKFIVTVRNQFNILVIFTEIRFNNKNTLLPFTMVEIS